MSASASEGNRFVPMLGFGLRAALALTIGGFSCFVGYMKAFAPIEVLAEHTAWTVHLPVIVGRGIGWLEMAAAAVLILTIPFPRLARAGFAAAAWITLNHSVAAIVHILAGEYPTLVQSAVLISLCILLLALLHRAAGEAAA